MIDEQTYEILVNYAPFFTTGAFIAMYAYTIYDLHRRGAGSQFNRIFFLTLTVALIPKFLAQLTLMLVYGAYGPLVAEVSNLAPVLYIVAYNEYLLRKGLTDEH